MSRHVCVIHSFHGDWIHVPDDEDRDSCRKVGPLAIQELTKNFLDFLTLENSTDRLSWNVGNYHSTLRNILQERRNIYTAAEAWNHAR